MRFFRVYPREPCPDRTSRGRQTLIRPRRAVRITNATGPFSAFVAAMPNMRKSDVTAPSPRAHDGAKRIGTVGTIILATQVPIISL